MLAAAPIAVQVSGPARADPLVQAYAIRGLAGVAFSRGMNALCDEIASIPQAACSVEDFYNASSVEEKAAAAVAAGQRLVLVGHSLGAHAALRIAGAMKGTVPLVVSIDPNWFAPPAVPDNALVVLNYYQSFDVLGRAPLQAPAGFRGELRQFERSEPHVLIDRSPEIHAEVIARIKDIVGASLPPARSARPDRRGR